MRITVTGVDDAATVRFRCAAGAATGRWAGPLPPVPGEHDVELDVAEEVVFARAEPGRDRVEDVPDGSGAVLVAGRVEQAGTGADAVVVLRVGGGLLLLEACGAVPSAGDRVRFTAAELRLYPTGV
ncbi:hypothetical protein ABZ234_26710 [Nocardiopsis sp. NPDC006198]|uniref:hypothetical protein n=1 Tax=Nocardiopsis sp. NPDC006198 TaxID=3154472 RepID=UPI0033B8B0B3